MMWEIVTQRQGCQVPSYTPVVRCISRILPVMSLLECGPCAISQVIPSQHAGGCSVGAHPVQRGARQSKLDLRGIRTERKRSVVPHKKPASHTSVGMTKWVKKWTNNAIHLDY